MDDLINSYNTNMQQLLDEMTTLSDTLQEMKLVDSVMVDNFNFYKRLCTNSFSINKIFLIESMAAWIIENPEFVDNIIKKNLEFFIKYDYTKASSNDKNMLELINCIKNVIIVIDKENQDILFEYIEVLCGITIKYVNKKYNI
jgi:hypothetical protein